MPTVTVWLRPKGLPIATTQSAISTSSESPSGRTGSGWSVSTLRRARSVSESVPRIRASSVWEKPWSSSVTLIRCARSTTWALVTISPEGWMTKPAPSPSEGPEKPSKKSGKGSPCSMGWRPTSSTAIETTAGRAFFTSSVRAGMPSRAEEARASANSVVDRSVQSGPSKDSIVGAATRANASRTAATCAAMHHPLAPVEDVHGRHACQSAGACPLADQALQGLAVFVRDLVGGRRLLLRDPGEGLLCRFRRHALDLGSLGEIAQPFGQRLLSEGDADGGDAGEDREEAEEGPSNQGEHAAIVPPSRRGASRRPVGTFPVEPFRLPVVP